MHYTTDIEIGEIINNKWEVIDIFWSRRKTDNRSLKLIRMKCLDCGYISEGQRYDILKRKNCRHCKKVEVESMIGEKYGNLTVERIATKRNRQGNIMAECLCDCGNMILASIPNLKNSITKSCGCARVSPTYSHGMTGTRLHNIWKGMKTRCYNPNVPAYRFYGGKGVKICDEWLADFMNFYNWSMTNGYTDELSIDRIDPNGDYCPENCRWITMIEQQRNKSNTIYVVREEGIYTIGQLAENYGCHYNDIRYHYYNGELNNYLNQIYYNNMQNTINQIHNAQINQDYYNMKCKR